MTEHLVELRGVRMEYGETVAVASVDLKIEPGEFVVLLGPSGSGKTTILNIIGGFVTPTAGEIVIDGTDVAGLPPARRPTATVFQDYALFPHMNVASNVAFGLAMHKVPRRNRTPRVEEVLRLVGLEGFGRRSIHQLSGGQRQRVALARAIAVRPTVLLLDEPLGALDLALRRQMQSELVQIQKELGTTFIHVTHDQDEAMSIADTVVVLNHGRIEDMGPPRRVYLRPATLFTATFMGESNLIPGRVTVVEGGMARVATALGEWAIAADTKAGADVSLSLRPEQLALGLPDDDARIALGRARVTEIMFQGSHLKVTAMCAAKEVPGILLQLPSATRIEVGQKIDISAKAGDVVLLEG
jgi:spermidine/putrescine transport system ATP-binding protein